MVNANSTINFASFYWKFIYGTDKLIFTIKENATSLVTFEINPINLIPLLCPKKEPLKIVVRNSRINSKTWNLYAAIKDNSAKRNEFDISDSIVFKEENEVIHKNGDKVIDEKNYRTTITWSIE